MLTTALLAASPRAFAFAPAADASEEASPPAGDEVPTVESALESGDLTTAREQATAARESDPTPENWLTEAKVFDALGDYEGASESYHGYLDAIGDAEPDERAAVEGRLEEIEAASRGTVADEPESTHREAIDRERAEREAAGQLKPAPPPPAPEPPRDRVVKKWYFWVTLAAIAGAAGAITAISIKAANQERKDALDRVPGPNTGPGGPVLFRF
jgi:hypothetical protein